MDFHEGASSPSGSRLEGQQEYPATAAHEGSGDDRPFSARREQDVLHELAGSCRDDWQTIPEAFKISWPRVYSMLLGNKIICRS